MAAEFGNGGFAGENFEYDLFDLKYIVGRSAQQAAAAVVAPDRKPSLLKRVLSRRDEQAGLGLEAEGGSDGEENG
jgi:hypothetical protein